MDESHRNLTRDFILAILDETKEERQKLSVQSICQYASCRIPMNDDNNNTICHVTSASSTLIDGYSNQDVLDNLAKHIHLYIYPLFIFIGILGNSLSCFIMFINVRRHGYPTSLYLTLLAFVDCLFLLGSALPDWIAQFYSKLDIKQLSNLSCRLVYWFGHLITHLSAGLVVGVTVERFIAVQYPLIAHKINTVRHTRIALLFLFLFFFVLDSPVLILVRHLRELIYVVYTCHNDTQVEYHYGFVSRCVLANKHYDRIWVYIDFAAYTFVPFLLIITLNSLIIRRLIDAQRFRERMFRFSNHLIKSDQQDSKYRHFSESHQAIEMLEKPHRCTRRFQSVPETRPLAKMLRPQPNQSDERRRHYSTKQSSISTELSTLSSEIKIRSQHQLEIPAMHCKSPLTSNANSTRLTILLLTISCSFLILTLPYVVLNLILSIQSEKINPNNYRRSSFSHETHSKSSIILAYTIARLLMIINHSINFILYFVLGKRFRRDLKQLFAGFWRKFYR